MEDGLLSKIRGSIMAEKSISAIRPVKPAPLDRFCRLFCPVEPAFDACAMTSLGCSMKNELSGGTNIPHGSRPTTIPAGFTYFGQFIDHDLTRDDTFLDNAGKLSPTETLNGGGGRLDLNHLYGDGPMSNAHGHLYAPDQASFLLGDSLSNGEPFDLLLKDNKPQAADDRSTENIFLRQLCAMFMKLHNLAVKELPADWSSKERFERARTRVRWQYQWIIRNEYLGKICLPAVYRDLFGEGDEAKPQMIDWESDGFSIPIEFSLAAFRFGHSLVRPAYSINAQSVDVPLERLFGSPDGPGPISPSLAVDWCRFLKWGEKGGPELAMAIDTVIATPLFHLPAEHVHHVITDYAPPLPPELPVRTLRRGAAIGLASGEEVAEKFGRAALRSQTPEGYAPWANLDDLNLAGRTPLWYYILLEAELEQQGQSLGSVGSRLVAEVIEGALRADPESFLVVNGPKWTPPLWKDVRGKPVEIERLVHVATAVGLTNCLP
jgi:hypothetical protein